MKVAIPTRLILKPNDIGCPTLDQIRWEGVHGKKQIDPELYNKSQIIIVNSDVFDKDQDCLKQIAKNMKKGRQEKGFNDDFEWHNSNYTAANLIEHGFMMVSTHTIFVVPDGAARQIRDQVCL